MSSILSLPRKAVSGLARVFLVKAALAAIRKAAEGDYGASVQHVYWALAGVKTITGVTMAIVAAYLAAGGYTEGAIISGAIAAFLVEAGILDKAWRTTIPNALRASRLYQFLAGNAELVSAAAGLTAVGLYDRCGGAAAWASTSCQLGALGFGLLTVGLIHVGLLDAAWKSPRPIPYPTFERGRRE